MNVIKATHNKLWNNKYKRLELKLKRIIYKNKVASLHDMILTFFVILEKRNGSTKG